MSKYYFEIENKLCEVVKRVMLLDQKKIKVKSDVETFNIRESIFIVTLGKYESVTFSEIAQDLELDRKLLISITAKLQRKNIIDKKTSETDKRCQQLELTTKGRKIRDELMEQFNQAFDFIMLGLTINEEKAILKFLNKLMEIDVEQ